MIILLFLIDITLKDLDYQTIRISLSVSVRVDLHVKTFWMEKLQKNSQVKFPVHIFPSNCPDTALFGNVFVKSETG